MDHQVLELWQRHGGLPRPDEASDIWKGIWFEEAHHSTAIEGNTLVLKQVKELLENGRAVGDKELKEYMEVKGYADAATWVYGQAQAEGGWSPDQVITLTEIRNVHKLVMSPVWEVAPHPDAYPSESPGNFREHEIHPFPGGMEPASWPLVAAELAAWVDEVNSLEPRTPDFPDHLAAVHSRFERVHPFIDGNGRTGRLLLNLVLVRLGYPPAVIYKRQRNEYLKALRRADAGDPGSLGELLCRAVLYNLSKFIYPAIAGPARIVPISALATEEISAAALRVAARRNRLQATIGPDNEWRSSRNWVNEYLKSRHAGRPNNKAAKSEARDPEPPEAPGQRSLPLDGA